MESDPCITVWTPEAHEQTVAGALAGQNPLGSTRRKIQRFFQANSFDLELDSAGRVTVPGQLLTHAGIDKEVVVAGVGDHLELWSEAGWRQEQQALSGSIGEVTEELGDPS